MKKDKLQYVFVVSYVLSFICLVLEYVRYRPNVKELIIHTKELVKMTPLSFNLLLIFSAVVLSVVIYLIQYTTIRFAVRQVAISRENIAILAPALLISESVCYAATLSLLHFLSDSMIQFLLIPVGLVVFYSLLKGKLPNKLVCVAILVRAILYGSNLVAVLLGLV